MLEKDIVYFGKPAQVACDNNCRKAWGISMRPCVYFDASGVPMGVRTDDGLGDFEPRDWDNHAYIPDYLLGEAPDNPGTSEGFQYKPPWEDDTPAKINKWCVRQCERNEMESHPDDPRQAPLALPDFGDYRFNIPAIARLVKSRPGWKEALDAYCRGALA